MHSIIANTAIFSATPFATLEEFNVTSCHLEFLFHNKRLARHKNATHTIADPFLVVCNDELYLFVEEVQYGKHGEIIAYKTKDLTNWERVGTILPKPYHQSYPFIFKHKQFYYLIPESEGIGELCIYKSTHLEAGWQLHSTALVGAYNDSNIIWYDNQFWLFASKGYNEQHIYYSSTMYNWKPLGNQPVVNTTKHGRNGGGVFMYNKQLYRVAQNCEKRYGDHLVLLKITELSPKGYKEIIINDNFIPNLYWWNKFGSHHFHYVMFKGKLVFAVDGFCNHFFINKLFTAYYKFKGQ